MAGAGYVVICLFFGLAGGVVGRIKGSSFVLWFLISALVPFLGLLTAIFYRWEDRELRRQCPGCGQRREAPRRRLHALRRPSSSSPSVGDRRPEARDPPRVAQRRPRGLAPTPSVERQKTRLVDSAIPDRCQRRFPRARRPDDPKLTPS